MIQAEGREKRNLGGAPGPGEIGIQPLPSGQNTAVRGYTEQYNYDALGNMLQIIHTSTRVQDSWNKYYHYTNGLINNFLQSTSTDNIAPTNPDYTYDAHGNMTAMPHLTSMVWDYADQLQSANLGGGGNVYFTYNAGGERVRKVRVNASGRRWERIYLGGLEIYRVVNASGTVRTERQSVHISDDKSRVALVDTLTINNGNPVGNPSPVFRYQLNNHLETASLELDENADIISYEEFYPFGSTSYRAGRSNNEVNEKRYRYVGKEKDGETGLYYYGARYYASWLCRFISVDPLKDDYPQLNSYNYAGNNPVSDKDVDGRQNFNSEVRPKGLTQPSDATTHVAGNNARQRFENRNLPISESKNQFVEFFKELGNIGIGILKQIGNSPNFEGYSGPSAKPPSKEKLEQYSYSNFLKQLDPNVQIQNFSETVVTGTFNLIEGTLEGDGRKLARAVPFVAELVTVKGLSKLIPDVNNLVKTVDNFQGKFKSGASKLVSTKMLDEFPDSSTIGNPKGTFVAPTPEIDDLLSKGLSRVEIAKALGIDDPLFLEGDLIKVDIIPERFNNLRPPTGKEIGANNQFIPGGKTVGGVSEGILDNVEKSSIGIRIQQINP